MNRNLFRLFLSAFLSFTAIASFISDPPISHGAPLDTMAGVQFGGISNSVVRHGTHLYVGVGSRVVCLSILSPISLGERCGKSVSLPGVIEALAVSEQMLIAVSYDIAGKRAVYDISRNTGALDWPATRIGDYSGISKAVLQDRMLYILSSADLTILKEIAPHVWSEMSSIKFDAQAVDFVVDEQRIYIAFGPRGLRIFQQSQVGTPVEISRYTVDNIRGLAVTAVALFALIDPDITDPNRSLGRIIALDTSSPARIRESGRIIAGLSPDRIRAYGDRLYGSDSSRRSLLIVDASDVARIRELAMVPIQSPPLDITANERTAWVATESGLLEMDVENAGAVHITGQYYETGNTLGLEVSGTSIIAVDEFAGLRVIQHDAQGMTGVSLSSQALYGTGVIGVEEATGFMGFHKAGRPGGEEGETGIRTIDLADANEVRVAGKLTMPIVPSDGVLQGGLIYLTDANALIRVIDLREPAAPREIAFLAAADRRGSKLALDGQHAVVTLQGAGIGIFDVSNPNNPRETGFWPAESGLTAQDVDLVGTVAYVTFRSTMGGASAKGLALIDIGIPHEPRLLGTVLLPEARRIWVIGPYAYVSDSKSITVIDVSDTAAPRILGEFGRSACVIYDVVRSERRDVLYLANGSCGIRVFPVWGDVMPSKTPDVTPSTTPTITSPSHSPTPTIVPTVTQTGASPTMSQTGPKSLLYLPLVFRKESRSPR